MAKVTVEFDTEEKDLMVKIDGVEIPDVVCAEFSQSYDDDDMFRVCITSRTKNELTNMRELHHLMAGKTSVADATPSAKFPAFVEQISTSENQVIKDIAELFGC